jgi:elongation factor P
MAQLSTNEFGKGAKVLLPNDKDPYAIIDFEHVKPGKGQAFTRVKLKNLKSGRVVEQTFKSGDKLDLADISEVKAKLSYKTEDGVVFMHPHTFDEIVVTTAILGECAQWLMEEVDYSIVLYNDLPIGVEPPTFLELKIVETAPGIRGDTSGRAQKDAVVESGAKIRVNLFIEEGDIVKVDTRTGEYVSRVQK